MLQATLDAEAQGPGDMTARVRASMEDTSPEDFSEIVWMLKSARCLDVTEGPRTEEGKKVIASINGITTRGLRELQKGSQAPAAVHSCPTDGDDGRLGFLS